MSLLHDLTTIQYGPGRLAWDDEAATATKGRHHYRYYEHFPCYWVAEVRRESGNGLGSASEFIVLGSGYDAMTARLLCDMHARLSEEDR